MQKYGNWIMKCSILAVFNYQAYTCMKRKVQHTFIDQSTKYTVYAT